MPTEQAIGESVRWLLGLQELVRAPFTPQFGPSITGAGGSTPTIVIAASNTSQKTQIKADYTSPMPDATETFRVALQDLILNRGGGRILLTEGDYYFSDAITLIGAVRFEGMGQGATRLHMATAANDSMFVLNHAAPNPIDAISFSHLDMDGHKDLQTAGTSYGIYIAPNGLTTLLLNDVAVHDFRTIGVQSDRGARNLWMDRSQIYDNTSHGLALFFEGSFRITDSDIYQNGDRGIFCDAAQEMVLKGNRVYSNGSYGIAGGGIFQQDGQVIANNYVYLNGNHGIYINGHAYVMTGNYCASNTGAGIGADGVGSSTVVNGNNCIGNTLEGIILDGGFGGTCAGNTVQKNGRHGISVIGNDWNVIGNKVESNSRTTNNTYDGIIVSGDDNDIIGNTIRANLGGNAHRYGINIAATADATYAVVNDARGSVTADYIDNGTNTVNTVAGPGGFGDNR